MAKSLYPYSHSLELVREFHETFDLPVARQPNVSTVAQRKLRVALIAEELGELCQALGVSLDITVLPVTSSSTAKEGVVNGMQLTKYVGSYCHQDEGVDLVEAADALGDLDYVVQGSNLVFGFPAGPILEEIHASNMSKLGEDGKPIYAENGKVLKGPNYHKPNVMHLLQLYSTIEGVADINEAAMNHAADALTLASTQDLVFELATRFKGQPSEGEQ